jgi:hypothetical protein
MTTAYNLMETVIRPQKRPSTTSTSAAITRPIFGDSPVKDLPIPVAIDTYNHHIGGVDIANQYRVSRCQPMSASVSVSMSISVSASISASVPTSVSAPMSASVSAKPVRSCNLYCVYILISVFPCFVAL